MVYSISLDVGRISISMFCAISFQNPFHRIIMYALILLELLNGASHVTVREELVRSSNLKFRGAAGATERMARSVKLWEKISAMCVMRTGVKGGSSICMLEQGLFFYFHARKILQISKEKKHLKTCLHMTEWLAIKIWGRNLEDFWETIFLACVLMLYISNPCYHLWKLIKKKGCHTHITFWKNLTLFFIF